MITHQENIPAEVLQVCLFYICSYIQKGLKVNIWVKLVIIFIKLNSRLS